MFFLKLKPNKNLFFILFFLKYIYDSLIKNMPNSEVNNSFNNY